MKKVMFDTNIYDALVADTATFQKLIGLIDRGEIQIITTHIQDDELPERIKEAFHIEEEEIPTSGFVIGVSRIGQAKLGHTKSRLKEENLPTAGAVWGVSKWGESKWGDGSQSGISLDDIATATGNHIEDALIATTASENCDIFVTNDARLFKRLKKIAPKCQTMNYEGFKNFISSN